MEEKFPFIPGEELVPEFVLSVMSETMDWGMGLAGIPEAHKLTRGAGITVAILDTGCASHPDLMDGMLPGIDCTGSAPGGIDGQGHGCVLPSDIIYTSSHGLVSIEDFYNTVNGVETIGSDGAVVKIISDNVSTISFSANHQTVMSQVQAVHKLTYSGSIYQVETRDGTLSLTPWHPIYVQTSTRGTERTIVQKRADKLKVGDILVTPTPRQTFTEFFRIPYRTYFCCKFCGYEAKTGKRRQCKSCNKCSWHSGSEVEELVFDENMAYWLGLVASDGHIMSHSKSIEFVTIDEVLSKKFTELSWNLFRIKTHEYPDARSPKTKRLRLHSEKLHAFVQTLGIPAGSKSLTLELPQIVARSPREVVYAFFAGMIDGDGHVGNRTRVRISTGSRKFADASVLLLKNLGIRSFVLNTKAVEGNQPHYQIRVGNCHAILERLHLKRPDMNLVPSERPRQQSSVTKITIKPHDGLMYDLTVKESHNYAANGFIVSNTHVSGIVGARQNDFGIIGIAPECKILPIKVLDDGGHGGFYTIEAGIRAAMAANVDIINMSLGAPFEPPASLHAAIQEAAARGIILVAAAGNDSGAVNYPARYDEVIAVAALDKNGELASFSSRGTEVDAGAPGVDIYSTYLNNQYALLKGTSQASPFIAGVCALILAWARKNNLVINGYKHMLHRLNDLSDPGGRVGLWGDRTLGFGVPNFANVPNIKWDS